MLLASVLPDLGTSDRAVFVASAAGILAVALVVLTLTATGKALVPVTLLAVGTGLGVARSNSFRA